jgi:hypothetical protein
MDRYLQPGKKKKRLIKEFECLDIIPYSIALVLLVAQLYIVLQLSRVYTSLRVYQ